MKKDHIKPKFKTRKYRKNRLSRRITRTMTFSNFISTVLLMLLMVAVIGTMVGLLGAGFTDYASKQIGRQVEHIYMKSMDQEDFKKMVEMMEDNPSLISQAQMEEVMGMMDESGEIRNFHDIDLAQEFMSSIHFFDYKIFFKDMLLYDSMMDASQVTNFEVNAKDTAMETGMFGSGKYSIYDAEGDEVALVEVTLSAEVIFAVYFASISLAIVVLLLNLIISKIVSWVTSRIVSRPLEVMAAQMEALANEELEDAFNTELKIKNPVSEVASLVDSTEKIMAKMSDYYQTMLAQNQELEAQRDVLAQQRDELESQRDELESQRDELEAQNEELTVTGANLQSMNTAYMSRTLKLQNLMDNIGQGFITFNEDLLVNAGYSSISSRMLCDSDSDREIEGKKVTELLFKDPSEQEFIDNLLVKTIQGSLHERNLFMPLLPDEIVSNNRILKIDYKMVNDEHRLEQMMMILTDITETRVLEDQVNQERDVLQMIVKVLLNREDFIELHDGFKVFLKGIFDHVEEEAYDETLRVIHTYKGSFGQFFMNTIADKLNDTENMIYEDGTVEGLMQIDSKGLLDALQKDMDIIEAYVGKDFIRNRDLYTVKEEKILEIEHKIRKILPASEYNKIMPIIKSIRYKSVKESLRTYPDYVNKLADRLGKSIAPFEVTGDEISVDIDIYHKVFKSFVHIFRNAVDHGIEDMDTRIEKDKTETASITCHVEKEGSETFTITIADDGKGLDPEKLVSKAIEVGIITEEAAEQLSLQEKYALIFRHGVTTKEKATAISGRGVGLAATKELVDYLGGEILIESARDEGAKFIIRLPLLQSTDIIDFEPRQFLERIETVASDFFKNMDMDLGEAVFKEEDRITLYRVSALLNIKGSMDGIIVISSNEGCSRALVNGFIYGDVSEEDIATYAEDVLGEVTNTIMGNVLGSFEEDGVYLNLGVPVMLSNRSAYIKYSNRQILSARYEQGDFVLTINLLLTDSSDAGLTHHTGALLMDDSDEGGY